MFDVVYNWNLSLRHKVDWRAYACFLHAELFVTRAMWLALATI